MFSFHLLAKDCIVEHASIIIALWFVLRHYDK